ncbi:MAG: polysaccharide deacetylase family protein [Tyzzerella sp.]|nr:polysaccharide deacetylase family protein [Tyzzerella sp.]
MKIRRRSKMRFIYKNEIIAGLVIVLAALLVFFGIKAFMDRAVPVVTLRVDNLEIRQDEEIPAVQVSVSCDDEKAEVVLDKKTGYTLADLIADFNAGKGYLIEHEVNASQEGSYSIKVKLDEEMEKKLTSDWSKKFSITYEEGVLTVKSKYGDWEDHKFKLLDGTYAAGWMNFADDTYYFGEDGNYVTGECEIGGRTYYFKKNGKFDTEKNPINPNRPMIALTFDDGPGPYTETLLTALEEHGVKATFFMLGTRVNRYPEVVKKMVAIGCELGNHSTNHPELTKLNAGGISAEIDTTNQAIQNAAGQPATLVRPPYGSINSVVRATVQAPLILWSVDTLDWESQNVEMIKGQIMSTVKDGDVVLMHDIYETTVQAIIELIPELKEQGYQFLTVSELAEMRGVSLQNGEKYRSFYK